MNTNRPDLDLENADVLEILAKEHRCQARILVDRGQHYVYCGAYHKDPAKRYPCGWRCAQHAPEVRYIGNLTSQVPNRRRKK